MEDPNLPAVNEACVDGVWKSGRYGPEVWRGEVEGEVCVPLEVFVTRGGVVWDVL